MSRSGIAPEAGCAPVPHISQLREHLCAIHGMSVVLSAQNQFPQAIGAQFPYSKNPIYAVVQCHPLI